MPQWGHVIRKIECANHAIKCYRGALEKLAQENSEYRGKGRLTSNMRKRLTKAARCAIKMQSDFTNKKHAADLLREDLRNGPLHCFGVHTECSTDYCQVMRDTTTHTTPACTSTSTGTASTSTASTITACTGTASIGTAMLKSHLRSQSAPLHHRRHKNGKMTWTRRAWSPYVTTLLQHQATWTRK